MQLKPEVAGSGQNINFDPELSRLVPTPFSIREQVATVEYHFSKIMEALGLDLTDDSLKNTPLRVAKMYVNETFGGLNPLNEPRVTLFENKYKCDEIVLEKNIQFYSCCEHHFLPIIGKAHIAYIPQRKIAELSKLNRVVHYFSNRPQVQERLTIDIAIFLKAKLQTEHVAVIMEAEHLCVAFRGIKDPGATTTTSSYHGSLAGHRKAELIRLLFGEVRDH
jgi:GTP cyclohydrolase I